MLFIAASAAERFGGRGGDTGENRVEGEHAAIGVKFREPHQAGISQRDGILTTNYRGASARIMRRP